MLAGPLLTHPTVGLGSQAHGLQVACLLGIRPSEPHMCCQFHSQGFPSSQVSRMASCGTSHHARCFRAGLPFASRSHPGQSLSLPPLEVWPNFVCELCTVRAVLQQELGHPGDRWLLQLERVCIIDTFHHWSDGSLKAHQGSLRKVLRFERNHPGLHLLSQPTLEAPPPPWPGHWPHVGPAAHQRTVGFLPVARGASLPFLWHRSAN